MTSPDLVRLRLCINRIPFDILLLHFLGVCVCDGSMDELSSTHTINRGSSFTEKYNLPAIFGYDVCLPTFNLVSRVVFAWSKVPRSRTIAQMSIRFDLQRSSSSSTRWIFMLDSWLWWRSTDGVTSRCSTKYMDQTRYLSCKARMLQSFSSTNLLLGNQMYATRSL